ncbi:hypothetical protein [Listeria booriae]|uniref:Uncharacterized protein n=1 Tax=Listeria booriae TaxID=1552123 RepID=A0A841WD85_9LIST|nr:hypothetical protein [Listeria booriae]MBC1231531.1 hypothetical protein [Listeria booriae]MBC1801082.1 hypothetical protein [Listeria booriae]MBC2239802.1 hypothetical protein [Listeria booriae]
MAKVFIYGDLLSADPNDPRFDNLKKACAVSIRSWKEQERQGKIIEREKRGVKNA